MNKYFLYNRITHTKILIKCLKIIKFGHLPHLKFFLSRSLPEDTYLFKFIVSEVSTGARIGFGQSMKAAVYNTKKVINNYSEIKINSAILTRRKVIENEET